jgi:hypothetical protein
VQVSGTDEIAVAKCAVLECAFIEPVMRVVTSVEDALCEGAEVCASVVEFAALKQSSRDFRGSKIGDGEVTIDKSALFEDNPFEVAPLEIARPEFTFSEQRAGEERLLC